MPKSPFMSVVIISYNGEAKLGPTIESLLQQTYPKTRYEVIVVNDGSTDKTFEVAKRYLPSIKIVDSKARREKGGARNAGLAVYRGDIYVAFDDDCIAESTWLEELAKGYASGDPVGVGGRIAEPQPIRGLTNAYISAGDSNYSAQATVPSRNPFVRLIRYMRSRLPTSGSMPERAVVQELYGAGSSFPRAVLEQVGGWHEHMFGIEDRDINARIRREFPTRPFYVMPKAVITHDRGQTLLQYLLRSYSRGPINLVFHRKNHILPPVFPFPFLVALAAVASLLLSPWLCLAVLIGLPQMLYFWWLVYAWRKRQFKPLLFPYIQLAEESLTIAGLMRGYLQLVTSRLRHWLKPLRGALHFAIGLGVIGLWLWSSLGGLSGLPHTILSLLFLLIVPGYYGLLLICNVTRSFNGFRALVYSLGLSLLLLMLDGLAINQLYSALGWSHPLSTRPLALSIGALSAGLVFLAFVRRPLRFSIFPWRLHIFRAGFGGRLGALLTGLALPALAAAGAVTLNNGGSSMLACVVLGGIGLLTFTMLVGPQGLKHYFGWLLYGICASLLIGTSLRGWNITGHDVMQEYQVFQLTLQHAAWHMAYYQDAYMACLSITILPTIFQKLTGISDPYIFKLLFQLIFAVIAPLFYRVLRNFAAPRRALLATVLFLFFPTFLTDIMMLNRQEIALLFFVLSLYVGLDRGLGKMTRGLLAFLFLVGMVLSHYSTSYVAIAALLIALVIGVLWRVLLWVIRWRRGRLRFKAASIYHPIIILSALTVLFVWGTIVTQTSDNISRTAKAIAAGIEQKITHKNSAALALAPSSFGHYIKLVKEIRQLPTNDYYPDQTIAKYPVVPSSERSAPAHDVVGRLWLSSGLLDQLYSTIRTTYVALIGVFSVLGLGLALVLRKWRAQLPAQYVFLGLATGLLIAGQVYLPATAVNYGLARVIQQALLVLALPAALSILRILKLMRIPSRWRVGLLGFALVMFFAAMSGLLPAITGGSKPALSLANDGLYYQAYYTHQEEVASSMWLAVAPPRGSRVYSDEFMRRKLIAYGGIFATPTLVPAAIPIDSFVVLDYGNIAFDQVPAYDGPDVIYYKPPLVFLAANKDLVYSSDNVRIYR